MSNHISTDAKLIAAIRSGGQTRIDALREIFKNQEKRAKVIRFLKSRGCLKEDAEDLYQDAIIIFDRKVVDGDFMELASIENYIFGIVKLNWFNKFRSYQKQDDLEVTDDLGLVQDVSAYYERQERSAIFKKVLNLLGERCQELLLLSTHGFDTNTIAQKLGLSDKFRVQKEKYRCLNRLRAKIKNDAGLAAYIKNQLTPD